MEGRNGKRVVLGIFAIVLALSLIALLVQKCYTPAPAERGAATQPGDRGE